MFKKRSHRIKLFIWWVSIFGFLLVTIFFILRDSKRSSLWDINNSESELRQLSCPNGKHPKNFEKIEFQVTPVELELDNDSKNSLPDNIKYIAGFHLKSTDTRFGGLSGLTMIEDDNLLAVTDRGNFVKIAMNGNIPRGHGGIMAMKNPHGKQSVEKNEKDAEGIAYKDGLALVSYEGNHRVMAHDIGGCGGNARAALLSNLPTMLMGEPVKSNSGAEAIMIDDMGQLYVGFEAIREGKSHLIALSTKGSLSLKSHSFLAPDHFKLVGASSDAVLFRAYSSELGNRSYVQGVRKSFNFTISPPMEVDNFEGISSYKIGPNTIRLFLISDDNFSDAQKTLLYIFDVSL